MEKEEKMQMIFGHCFDFKDEPVLQKEYTPNPPSHTHTKRIQVAESASHSLTDEFFIKTDWIPLSGQEARFCSAQSFKKRDENLTWSLEIKDVVTLIWDASDKKISYIKGKNYGPRRLRFWIFHTFFPMVLELEHIYRILHVGSVEIKGKPVLFSAFSFGGKSTLTDYFIKQGHTMLSDDSMAIDKRKDGYYAISSYPFHRPYREAETLGHPVENFATEPKPLHAVYLLEKSEPDVAVEINELKGIEKFKAFHYSSFVDFSFMKQERFDFFTEMAKHIPIYKIKVPWDLDRLDEVYKAIVENSTEITVKK